MRARTSASQACGSMSFILAVTITLCMNAARSPQRSEPQNSHDSRPKAGPEDHRPGASQLTGDGNLARTIHAVNLEDVLGEINADGVNMHVDDPLR
jgi:hypothetical protein